MKELSALSIERTLVLFTRLNIRSTADLVGIHKDSPPALGAWIQGQHRLVLKNAIPVNHASENGDKHQRNDTQGAFDQDQGSPMRDHQIDCNSEEARNPQPAAPEEPNFVMKRIVIFSRNARARDIHRLQLPSMESCCGSPILPWSLEHTTEENSHKLKGASDGDLCSKSQESGGHIVVYVFRTHNHTLVDQEVRRHNLLRTIGDLRTDLALLPENKNLPPSNIRPVTS
ncbi:hypothetical protein AYI70_g10136 [Smittium culicis]|uniref:Uncharacterized protein n=1 Tax=Smittium culicis TaxID=133412 RepID=A0A1R1X7Y0_9FUNG|nr:hypothetical protein AYI70_g10136 [Smittium culicis]